MCFPFYNPNTGPNLMLLYFVHFLKDIEMKHNNKPSEIHQILVDEDYFNKASDKNASRFPAKEMGDDLSSLFLKYMGIP